MKKVCNLFYRLFIFYRCRLWLFWVKFWMREIWNFTKSFELINEKFWMGGFWREICERLVLIKDEISLNQNWDIPKMQFTNEKIKNLLIGKGKVLQNLDQYWVHLEIKLKKRLKVNSKRINSIIKHKTCYNTTIKIPKKSTPRIPFSTLSPKNIGKFINPPSNL